MLQDTALDLSDHQCAHEANIVYLQTQFHLVWFSINGNSLLTKLGNLIHHLLLGSRVILDLNLVLALGIHCRWMLIAHARSTNLAKRSATQCAVAALCLVCIMMADAP